MKELRQYGAPEKYSVRQGLFADAEKQLNPDDYFMAVKDELARMAAEDELNITEIHNLSNRLRDTCGMIILGQEWEYGSSPRKMISNADGIPEVIKNYKVRVRSLTGESIKWKKGREFSRSRNSRENVIQIYEDVWIDTEQTEAELFCAEAWRVLHQAGKFCRRANRSELKRKLWKYEEVSKKKIDTSKMKTKNSQSQIQASM